MTEDYGAPLGLDRAQLARRRLPLWPFIAGLAVLLVAGLGAFAALNPDPYGGQPHVVVDLPAAVPSVPVVAAEPTPPAEPDDPGGQIIIRDP